MKLIVFIDEHNTKVYINPAYVIFVYADEYLKDLTVIETINGKTRVKGEAEEVASKLLRGYSV